MQASFGSVQIIRSLNLLVVCPPRDARSAGELRGLRVRALRGHGSRAAQPRRAHPDRDAPRAAARVLRQPGRADRLLGAAVRWRAWGTTGQFFPQKGRKQQLQSQKTHENR